MKLNVEQLQEIRTFIHKKGVERIEAQNEILDHVACAVEDKINQNPKLTLSAAISEVYASFGIFGFLPMQESIEGRVMRQMQQYSSHEYASFFNSWRIVYPILIGVLIWLFLPYVHNYEPYTWYGLLFILFTFCLLGIRTLIALKKQKSLLVNFAYSFLLIKLGSNIGLISLINFFAGKHFTYTPIILSILITFAILRTWVAFDTCEWGKREFKVKYQVHETL